MRKYIFIIFILIISIIFSFQYLSKIIHSKKAYPFEPSDHAFLLQKKDISIYEEDAFVFEDYFEIYTKGRLSYNYRFQDGEINIDIADKSFSYPYEIKEKETVEKIVYEQVIKEVQVPVYTGSSSSSASEQNESIAEEEYEQEYFTINKECFSYPSGTELSSIIYDIQSNIDSNMNISVDYSLLNPNQIGQYSLFLIANGEKREILVNIV